MAEMAETSNSAASRTRFRYTARTISDITTDIAVESTNRRASFISNLFRSISRSSGRTGRQPNESEIPPPPYSAPPPVVSVSPPSPVSPGATELPTPTITVAAADPVAGPTAAASSAPPSGSAPPTPPSPPSPGPSTGPGSFRTAPPSPPSPGRSKGIGPFRAPSPAPSNCSATSRLTADDLSGNEDPFAFVSMFDTVFVIDDSGSMAGRPWNEVHNVLAAIVPICTQRDADGVDIYFLNHRSTPDQQQLLGRTLSRMHQNNQPRVPAGKSSGGYLNVRSDEAVGRIFDTVRPTQSTPTGLRLGSILTPYLRFYDAKRQEMMRRGEYGDPDPEEVKPMNIIVITDGVPTDDLELVLIDAAKKLDAMDAPPYQVGIQFFQVGTEPEAASYLKHLDDTLGQDEPAPIRDMVDTVTWNLSEDGQPMTLTADQVLKAVLGAVVKRLDNVVPATRGGHGGAGRAQRTGVNTLHP